MPRGRKVSPHHRGRRKTHFLVRTSTIFGADVHNPKGCWKSLCNKVCVDFLAPKVSRDVKSIAAGPLSSRHSPVGLFWIHLEKFVAHGAVKILARTNYTMQYMKVTCKSQTEIYPVQNWSLEMPQEPFSRPQPQYWIKLLDPMGAWFLSCTGLGSGNLIERAQFHPSTRTG